MNFESFLIWYILPDVRLDAVRHEWHKIKKKIFLLEQELKDVHHKDQMAAARGVLQRNIPMLYTASRACLQHPDVAAYKANRDLIYRQLQNAVSGISNAAQAAEYSANQQGGGGELAHALNNFDVSDPALGVLNSVVFGHAQHSDVLSFSACFFEMPGASVQNGIYRKVGRSHCSLASKQGSVFVL